MAITLEPIHLAESVPLKPTGPCPKIATLSRPDTLIFFNPFQAVPVPHEIAAPAANESSLGRCTNVRVGTRI
jgi:hypothetical protein